MAHQIRLNQKRSLGTQQNITTFSQYLLFLVVVGPSLIFIILFLMSITFSQQILGNKMLLVLN